MTTENKTVLLRRLIEIGESQDFSVLQQLFVEVALDGVGHRMRNAPQFDDSVIEPLSDAELEALIRAITIAERDVPLFSGGSASGVISLFRCLAQRKRRRPDDLADWVLANTTNSYAPFGVYNRGGARSIAAWDAHVQLQAERLLEKLRHDQELHRLSLEGKAEKTTKDLFSAIRRKDIKAVQALSLRGAQFNVPGTEGMTALAYARSFGRTPIFELLRNVTKQYYLNLRNLHLPSQISTVFVLESPPVSGKYFYDESGKVTEPLFSAMMKLLDYVPATKKDGLEYFSSTEHVLVDATYEPVNTDKLNKNESERNGVILDSYTDLVNDLWSLGDAKEIGVVLIKANICRLLESRLKSDGFNVLNNGVILPFPSTGHSKEFSEIVPNVYKYKPR